MYNEGANEHCRFFHAASENSRTNIEIYLCLLSLSLAVLDYAVPTCLLRVKSGTIFPGWFFFSSTKCGIVRCRFFFFSSMSHILHL